MRESQFKLKEKTIVLTGSLTVVHQAIANRLTEYGADVALIDPNPTTAEKFANQLMDQREANAGLGRATAIKCDFSQPQQVREAISRTAEIFGSVDALIDGHMAGTPIRFQDPNSLAQCEKLLHTNLLSSLHLTHAVLPFLQGRKRGRLIYLVYDTFGFGFEGESINAASRMGLVYFVKSLAREIQEKNITANCVSLGLTEEYLMSRFPQAPTINEAKSLISKSLPHAQIADANEIANLISFLASPLSGSLTGQTLSAGHGLHL